MFDTFILNDTDIAGSPFIQLATEMIILRFRKLPGLWQAMVNCDRLLNQVRNARGGVGGVKPQKKRPFPRTKKNFNHGQEDLALKI